MASERKFYVTTFIVRVLSEEPLNHLMDLSDVNYYITDGEGVGEVDARASVEIDAKKCADMTHEFGSDPGFFRLDDEGNDTDEL